MGRSARMVADIFCRIGAILLKLIAVLVVLSSSLFAQNWPIGVSANKRYFVDSTGAPWLMVADTGHHIISDLAQSGYGTYLSNRVQYGFNAINIFGSCSSGSNCPSGGVAQDGTHPFTSGSGPSSYHPATPHPALWSKG